MGQSGVKIKTDTSRALDKLVLEQKKPIYLICSTEKGQAYADAAVAKTGNTGNGAVTGVGVGQNAAKDETFELECIIAAANGGTFKVTGSLSGLQTAQAVVGGAYNSDGGELQFTINDGAVDFIVGDKFTIATHATRINKPTPVASLADLDAIFGKITSGANITLAAIAFKADDRARAMVIAALANGAPGGLYVVSAKAHGATRNVAPTNGEYQAAIDACKPFGTKIMVHESIVQADQVSLAQFAFDQSAPEVAKFTFAFFALGTAQSLANYTARSAAIDGGVNRGNNTDDPTPYALVAPAPLDQAGIVSVASAIAGAVALACYRAAESDPAMPLVSKEPVGFGGLEKEWTDGTTSEHDQLNDAGVSTLKTKSARIVVHRVVSCIQNSTAQAKQYAAWHDEPAVWINFYLKEDLLTVLLGSPFNRTKNTAEIRSLMEGAVRQRLRNMERVVWPTSSGPGIIENAADHEDEVRFSAHPSNPNKAVGEFTYDSVNALYGVDITAHVIV